MVPRFLTAKQRLKPRVERELNEKSDTDRDTNCPGNRNTALQFDRTAGANPNHA